MMIYLFVRTVSVKFEDENEDGSVEDEREAWFKNNSHLGKGIEENMSADQIMQAYKEIYKVSDVYSEDEQRRIVGIRYAAEQAVCRRQHCLQLRTIYPSMR